MATMKRRVVYLSDTEWEWLRVEAQRLDRSMSAHIRERLGFDGRAAMGGEDPRQAPAAERFNTQPFRGPIPKKGK